MEASQLFYHSEFTRVLVNRSWKHSNLQIAENYWQIWKQLSNANSANSLGFFSRQSSSIGLEQQGKRWTSSLGKLTASPSYFRKKRHLSQKLVTDFTCDLMKFGICAGMVFKPCLFKYHPQYFWRVWTVGTSGRCQRLYLPGGTIPMQARGNIKVLKRCSFNWRKKTEDIPHNRGRHFCLKNLLSNRTSMMQLSQVSSHDKAKFIGFTHMNLWIFGII